MTYKDQAQRRADMILALGLFDLTAEDRKLLDWLAGWDQATTDRVADLFARLTNGHDYTYTPRFDSPQGGAMTSITTHMPPTAVSCPEWCTDPAGHPYDQLDGSQREVRLHARRFGDLGDAVSIDVVDTVVYREGGEHRVDGSPEITIWIGGNGQDAITNPEDARRLAGLLLDAADLLERVR